MYLRTCKTYERADGSIGHPNWQMDSDELLEKLDLKPGHPIPPDLEKVVSVIDGDGDPNAVYIVKQRVPGRRYHRVHVQCPRCTQLYPAGRIRQHARVHK